MRINDRFALNRFNLFGREEGAWVNIGLPRLSRRTLGNLRFPRLERCSRFGAANESDSQQPTGEQCTVRGDDAAQVIHQ